MTTAFGYPKLRLVLVAAITLAALISVAGSGGSAPQAIASSGPVPLLWLDATNAASYAGTGTTWTDLSGNNRHGTITGGVTFNATNKAFDFPGGLNGQGGYVALNTDLNSFTNGLTIEFEGEFGAVRSNWERIFDFALNVDNQAGGATNIANAFWVGQFDNFNELALEVWQNGTQAGYCYTATNQTALGAVGDRSFNKFVITLDAAAPNKCRIYKNGVELTTRATSYAARNFNPVGANANGSDYTLPLTTSRPSTFLGRSNFSADRDLEGSIRYIRLYDQTLTPGQVNQNATATVTFDANGGTGSMNPQTASVSGTLTTNSFTRYGYLFAGWNTDQNGNGVSYADGDTYPFSSSTTLYAQWNVDPNAVATTTTAAPTTTLATPTTTVAVAATPTTEAPTASSTAENLPVAGSSTGQLLGWVGVLMMFGTGLLMGPVRRHRPNRIDRRA